MTSTGVPFISALNLDGRTVASDNHLLCMTETQYDKLRNGELIKGDVVVCIRGSLGKHGRYPFDKGCYCFFSCYIALSFIRRYFGRIYYVMVRLSDFFFEIKKYDNGTAQPNLAAKSLEQFLVPLPPLFEQQRILEKIKEILSCVNNNKGAQ